MRNGRTIETFSCFVSALSRDLKRTSTSWLKISNLQYPMAVKYYITKATIGSNGCLRDNGTSKTVSSCLPECPFEPVSVYDEGMHWRDQPSEQNTNISKRQKKRRAERIRFLKSKERALLSSVWQRIHSEALQDLIDDHVFEMYNETNGAYIPSDNCSYPSFKDRRCTKSQTCHTRLDPYPIFKNDCLINTLRSLGAKVPYKSDGPFWALRDGN